MALYRCHFLDSRDRIEAHEEIDANSLADAIDRANAMLAERPQHNVDWRAAIYQRPLGKVHSNSE